MQNLKSVIRTSLYCVLRICVQNVLRHNTLYLKVLKITSLTRNDMFYISFKQILTFFNWI